MLSWLRKFLGTKPAPAVDRRVVTMYRDGVHGGWILTVMDSDGRVPGWYPGWDDAPYGGRLQWHERDGVQFMGEFPAASQGACRD